MVFDGGRSEIHAGSHVTQIGLPKTWTYDIQRRALKRWNAAIGNAVVTDVFVAKSDLGLFTGAIVNAG